MCYTPDRPDYHPEYSQPSNPTTWNQSSESYHPTVLLPHYDPPGPGNPFHRPSTAQVHTVPEPASLPSPPLSTMWCKSEGGASIFIAPDLTFKLEESQRSQSHVKNLLVSDPEQGLLYAHGYENVATNTGCDRRKVSNFFVGSHSESRRLGWSLFDPNNYGSSVWIRVLSDDESNRVTRNNEWNKWLSSEYWLQGRQ